MKFAIFASLFVVGGCTAQPEPIVDTKGVNMTAYAVDLEECREYATQVPVMTGVAKGTAAGAAYGAAVGAVRGNDIGEAAGVGAISGGAWSGLAADRDKQQVVKQCLRGRGYRVLN
jgi:hypothetical protein